GNWLYRVAYHAALKARAAIVKRRSKESQVNERNQHQQPANGNAWLDLQPLVDRELDALPDKYREPVVLCDLEGKSRKEVARQLGIAEGTLSSRLATARRLLAARLSRQGVCLSGGALAVMLSQQASAALPGDLVAGT